MLYVSKNCFSSPQFLIKTNINVAIIPFSEYCLHPYFHMNAAYYKVVVDLLVSNLPGAELIFTPLTTPKPVLIDESMISNMLNEY